MARSFLIFLIAGIFSLSSRAWCAEAIDNSACTQPSQTQTTMDAAAKAAREKEIQSLIVELKTTSDYDKERSLLKELTYLNAREEIPTIFERMEDRTWIPLSALINMKAIEILPQARKIVNDPFADSDLKAECVELVGGLGDRTMIPKLRELLDENRNADNTLEFSLIDALVALHVTEIQPELESIAASTVFDPSLLVRAIRAIGQLKLRASASKIRPFLSSQEESVASAAAEVVGELNDIQSVPILIKQIENEGDLDFLKAAISSLETLDLQAAKKLAKFYLQQLNDSTLAPYVQWEAIDHLSFMKDPNVLNILIDKSMNDPNEAIRLRITSNLTPWDDANKDFVSRLRIELNSKNPAKRAIAAVNFGNFGHYSTKPPEIFLPDLIRATHDSNPAVVTAVTHDLMLVVDSSAASEAIEESLRNPSPELSLAAIKSINQENVGIARPKIISDLRALETKFDNQELKEKAYRALLNLNAKEATPDFRNGLKNPDILIQEISINSLGIFHDRESYLAIAAIVADKNKSTDERAMGLRAILTIAPIKTIPVIEKILNDQNSEPNLRAISIETLGNLGNLSDGVAFLQALQSRKTSGSEEKILRNAFIKIASRISIPDALPYLIAHSKEFISPLSVEQTNNSDQSKSNFNLWLQEQIDLENRVKNTLNAKIEINLNSRQLMHDLNMKMEYAAATGARQKFLVAYLSAAPRGEYFEFLAKVNENPFVNLIPVIIKAHPALDETDQQDANEWKQKILRSEIQANGISKVLPAISDPKLQRDLIFANPPKNLELNSQDVDVLITLLPRTMNDDESIALPNLLDYLAVEKISDGNSNAKILDALQPLIQKYLAGPTTLTYHRSTAEALAQLLSKFPSEEKRRGDILEFAKTLPIETPK